MKKAESSESSESSSDEEEKPAPKVNGKANGKANGKSNVKAAAAAKVSQLLPGVCFKSLNRCSSHRHPSLSRIAQRTKSLLRRQMSRQTERPKRRYV